MLLRHKPIKEVMTVFPTTVEPEVSLQTVLRIMQRYDIRHLPVMEEQNLLGIVVERDVRIALRVKGVDGDREPIRDYVQKPNLVVSETEILSSIIKSMVKKKEDCAVITQNSKVVGIFTTTDAMRLLLDLL